MFGMVRLREVRHLKYTYKVHGQFGDSPSTDSDYVCELNHGRIYNVCLSVCLSVFESACFSIKKVYCPWPVTYISYVTALA